MRRGRKKRIPDASGAGDSFYVVAGTRCEVQQTDSPREIEVIPLTFEGQGRTMVLVGIGPSRDSRGQVSRSPEESGSRAGPS